MKRRKIIVLAVLSVLLASSVYAAENQSLWQRMRDRFFAPKASVAVAKTEALPAPEKHSEMTKEELLIDIKDNVDSEEGILDLVPSLKKGKDASGKDIYLFNGLPLENAGKEDLEKLAVSIGQIAAKMRADRIQGQLDTIRQAQAINQLQRIQTVVPRPPAPPPAIQRPPAPPVVQQPPRPPSAPSTTRR